MGSAPVKIHTEDDEKPRANVCDSCRKDLEWPDIFNCYFCNKAYCGSHRLPENHDCPKVMAAKHIDRDYLRKRGTNITTGLYMVTCRECGYSTGFAGIEEANQQRIDHIRDGRCASSSVKLKQHDDDRRADDEFAK